MSAQTIKCIILSSDASDHSYEMNLVTTHNLLKKNKSPKSWYRSAMCETEDEAKQQLTEETVWARCVTHSTLDGKKEYYKCKYRSKGNDGCHAELYLLYHAENQKVSIFRTEEDHENHDMFKRGIPQKTKDEIERLFEDGVKKPAAIMKALASRGYPDLKMTQLSNYLAQIRRQRCGSSGMIANELKTWCRDKRAVPQDVDKAFVVSCSINMDEPDEIRPFQIGMLISTRRLLQLCTKTEVFHADSTHIFIWQGFSLLLVGTTDKNRAFHPLGLAICNSGTSNNFEFIFSAIRDFSKKYLLQSIEPKVLVADENEEITDGFTSAFGEDFKRIVCYEGMLKKIDSKLRLLPKELKVELRSDIETLQLSSSVDWFRKAVHLFMEKWGKFDNPYVKEFVEYLHKSWIEDNCTWFEGIMLGVPKTNSALASTHKTLKDNFHLREKLPVDQFLTIIFEKVVPLWSNERNPSVPNSKSFVATVMPTMSTYKEANQWISNNKIIVSEIGENAVTFYCPSSKYLAVNGEVNEDIMKVLVNDYKEAKIKTFDEMKACMTMVWVLTSPGNDMTKLSCSCPTFYKMYYCKHSVGLQITTKTVVPPAESIFLSHGVKRKREEPKRGKTSLALQ